MINIIIFIVGAIILAFQVVRTFAFIMSTGIAMTVEALIGRAVAVEVARIG